MRFPNKENTLEIRFTAYIVDGATLYSVDPGRGAPDLAPFSRQLGSLSNGDGDGDSDGDGNENGKKVIIGLNRQNKNFARALPFFVPLLAVAARLQRESA